MAKIKAVTEQSVDEEQWLHRRERRLRLIREWAVGAVILAIAAFIRFFHIGTQPLWLDEGFSWWDSQQTLANLWNLVPQCDPHPPLYFAALKVWVDEFGDSAAALRALSAILGIATTAVMILAGREIDVRTGWLAGLLFALSPFQIDYGREARPYALLCFGAALTMLAALRLTRLLRDRYTAPAQASDAVDKPVNQQVTWAILICGGAILMWTNDTSILTLVSLGTVFALLLLLDRTSRSLLKPLLFVAAAIVILWLPYLPKLIEQTDGVVSDFWIPTPTAWHVKDTLRMLISLSSSNAFWWAIAALIGGLILLWRRGMWREALLLAALIVLPVALNYAVSMTVRPIFLSRTMIGITPAAVILMASAAVLLRSTLLRQSALTLLVAAHLFAIYSWNTNDQGNEPWDRIAKEIVAANSSIGERSNAIVLLAANQLALPFSHALEDLHASMPLQGAPTNFPAPGMKARYPSGKCAPSLLGQDLSPLARKIAAYPIVYFITRTDNVYDPGERVAKFLQALGFRQSFVETFAPGSLEVHKFVMNALKRLPTTQPGISISPR